MYIGFIKLISVKLQGYYIEMIFVNRYLPTGPTNPRTCYSTDNVISVSVKTSLGNFTELWNSKFSKKDLTTLSAVLANQNEPTKISRIIRIMLMDGTKIDSKYMMDDFSVNGPAIVYLPLQKDPLLLTNIAENITLWGQMNNGCFNGQVFGIAQWWKYPLELDDTKDYIDENPLYKVLNFIGYYNFGKLVGPIWKPVYSLDAVPIGYFYTYIKNERGAEEDIHYQNHVFQLR